jgi:hypothetical protein
VHSMSTERVACENRMRTVGVEDEYTSTSMIMLLQRVCRERARVYRTNTASQQIVYRARARREYAESIARTEGTQRVQKASREK